MPSSAPKEALDFEQDRFRQSEESKPGASSGAAAAYDGALAKRAVAAAPPAPKAAGGSGGGPLVTNQMQNQMQNQAANQYSNQAVAPPAGQAVSGGIRQNAAEGKVQAEKRPTGQDKKDAQSALKQKNETDSVGAVTETVEVTPAENSAIRSNLSTLTSNGRRVSALLLPGSNVIAAPDDEHAWRVGVAGRIERSSDAGKSWKAQHSGVTADLLSGSAPSAEVCWIVGQGETLLLTTDGGKHWKQLSSPISGAPGGVHALDAQHATIWDASKRNSFETADGGLTWKRVANE